VSRYEEFQAKLQKGRPGELLRTLVDLSEHVRSLTVGDAKDEEEGARCHVLFVDTLLMFLESSTHAYQAAREHVAAIDGRPEQVPS
jgi:hypothetical protein